MAGATPGYIRTALATLFGSNVTYNSSVGGATMEQVLARVQARQGLRGPITVWDGRATIVTTLSAYVDNFQNILSARVDKRHIFVPPVALSAGEVADILAITNDMIARGLTVRDAKPILAALSDGSPTDLADVAAGVVPSSLRDEQPGDTVHLEQFALDAVAAAIYADYQSYGWV